MRTKAVVALVVAAPRITAPLLAEQYFNHQYSLAQRSCMLIALATAVRELAGLPALHSLEAANESLIGTAIDRAKTEGEARVPEIQREKALQVNSTSRSSRSELSVSREERSSQHASSVDNLAKRYPSTLPGAMLAPLTRYLDVAVVYFLRPLIQRHWIALDELSRSASSNSRQSTANSILRPRMSTHGGGSTIASRRAGTGQVLSPSMVSRYLDCLAILAHAARHAVGFARTLVPQLFELVLATNTRMLCFSDLELNDKDEANEQHEAGAPDTSKLNGSRRHLTDAREAISASSASLILVLLDACWEMDGGLALMDELSRSTTSSQAGISSAIFADIIAWTEALFETEDAKGRRAASFGRSGRCAAAILVRVHEIRSHLGQRM
ncbi:hypothetical protein IE81DRAFT_41342 [Ceraceosorus guamensis]|uniref:Telomere length regulation protein conserved domain-containing protein n=1 Tax=Ceraceosorus guamensis TaxID=1522189 RepID=A0A316VNW4_9BASI|nr:hypothetical protein IE81DRAFT_41342 [Ceraceosorus guamensis]PWN39222.1 hypothetical protein IE81DRAFT_41342 [Ceraceosorus guamensis]